MKTKSRPLLWAMSTLIVVAAAAIIWLLWEGQQLKEVKAPSVEQQKEEKRAEQEEEKVEPIYVDENGYVEGMTLPDEPTYINGHLLANKLHPLPATFAPGESKEARAAFEKMAEDAKRAGFTITAFSTYRSYDYQVDLYNRYKNRDGESEADRYSARPGYSEHQTGLAFDIGEVGNEKDFASNRFGQTPAGQWVNENAARYGFILRYPEGKEEITGYMHESWHFRYVGDIAEEIMEKGITLEEYLDAPIPAGTKKDEK